MNASDAVRLAILLDRIEELATKIGVTFEAEVGQKFIRIVQGDVSTVPLKGGGFALKNRSVHAFVDIATGDIIKSASWKTPQKDKGGLAVRGNLVDDTDFARILSIADRYGSYLYKR